jgi:hypothetical protein
MPNTKICKSCGKEMPNTVEYFPKVAGKYDYLRSECIKCHSRNKNARAKARKEGKPLPTTASPTRKTFTIDHKTGLITIQQVIEIDKLSQFKNAQKRASFMRLWEKQGYEILEVKG